MELLRLGTSSACPDKEASLDDLGSGALSITFCACLPMGTRKSCQSILPHGNGDFPPIKLPLSGKELLLQLDGRHIRRKRSPTPINK
jgi:hypothetical protein